MDPISGAVEKTAIDSAIGLARKLWSWHTDVVKENKALKEENTALKQGADVKAEFERKKAALTGRQEDDNLYRDADGKYYCPLCLHSDSKFVPVTNYGEGSYYCSLHKQVFETEERRLRRQETRHQPIRYRPGHSTRWMR
jgi:hypothetical protein